MVRNGKEKESFDFSSVAATFEKTVVSQWKVDSASTAELMIAFQQDLKDPNGTTKAQALRQAALDLMNDKAYRHRSIGQVS